MESRRRSVTPVGRLVVGIVILVIGTLLVVGGGYLLFLGGSPYYLLSGFLLVACAVSFWRDHGRAPAIYGAFVGMTLIWAIWEVGLDAWQLVSRLVGPVVIGLLVVAVFRGPGRVDEEHSRALRWAAGAPLFVAVGVLVASMFVSASPFMDMPDRFATALPGALLPVKPKSAAGAEWTSYGGSAAGTRFSSVDQIKAGNVDKLKVAWTYRTGEVGSPGAFEATPLMVDDTLYLCTPSNVVIALDPETGKPRWRYDPKQTKEGMSLVTTCRGVAYYRAPAATECPTRILTATFDAKLIALDAKTGLPCRSFGDNGRVDLKEGLGPFEAGFYSISSAPTIVRGNVVIGGHVVDGINVGEPSGVIRAYSATTGSFSWAWDVGRPGQYGKPAKGETYGKSTPNSWAPMSSDEALGLVYAPMGSGTPDFWGAHRKPDADAYGSTITALDAETGRPRWSFATVHHDVWDYDVPAQPTLVDLGIKGRVVPALVQPTKRGEIFVLDRRTGRPVYPVTEVRTPQGASAGDFLSPTQPFSRQLPSFGGPKLSERDMWGITPLDQLWCRIRFRQLRYDGPMTPPNVTESLLWPGFVGGSNWGGVSVDPRDGTMIVNAIHLANIVKLVPRSIFGDRKAGVDHFGYGSGPYAPPQRGTPFGVVVTPFMSPLEVPCIRPPYGTLSAVDLRSGHLMWSKPFGTARDSGPLGHASGLPLHIGVPNMGGSLITASGLVFIAATQEAAFRAYDKHSGKELWYYRLPAGGQATPMTYVSPTSGRQFVVLAAGGNHVMQSRTGDYVIAFSLDKGQK